MGGAPQSGPLSFLVDALLSETQRAETTYHVLQQSAFRAAVRDFGIEPVGPLLAIDNLTMSFWLRPVGPSLLRRLWPWSRPKPAEFEFAKHPREHGAVQVTVELSRRDGKWQAAVRTPPGFDDANVPSMAVGRGEA
jgi:hypothetical protein